ncbi:MAG: hypothetical protein KGO49_06910 [Gammaproteobacteria bacterium]|nr:hypothetical protein [Gammaproteobacteria bacterium]
MTFISESEIESFARALLTRAENDLKDIGIGFGFRAQDMNSEFFKDCAFPLAELIEGGEALDELVLSDNLFEKIRNISLTTGFKVDHLKTIDEKFTFITAIVFIHFTYTHISFMNRFLDNGEYFFALNMHAAAERCMGTLDFIRQHSDGANFHKEIVNLQRKSARQSRAIKEQPKKEKTQELHQTIFALWVAVRDQYHIAGQLSYKQGAKAIQKQVLELIEGEDIDKAYDLAFKVISKLQNIQNKATRTNKK